jgi:hypothetical protein
MLRFNPLTRLPAAAQKILDDLEAERMAEANWRRQEAELALKRFSATRTPRARPWQSPESRRGEPGLPTARFRGWRSLDQAQERASGL